MHLWTLQPLGRLKDLKRDGILYGSETHADYPEPYAWLVKQMRQRLQTFSGNYPIWAWPQRPDLRRERWSYSEPGQSVLIEFEAEPETYLESEYGLWHNILNDCAVCLEHEFDYWHPPKEANREGYKDTWVKVFDLTYPLQAQGWFGPVEVQVTVDGLRKDQIRKVTGFAHAIRKKKS